MTEHLQATTTADQATWHFYTVCKRVFTANPAYFPRAEYRGKVIYLCTEACLDAFLADPERFQYAHSQPSKRK